MKLVHFIPSRKGQFFKGGLVHAESAAFLTATGITDSTIANAIDGILVPGIKSIGWSKFKAVYPFVGGTADTHKYNLIDPRDLDEAFRITWFGGVTHSADGVQGNGTNGYGNSHFIYSTHIGQISDTHMSFYSRTINAPAGDFRDIGSYTNVGIPYGINRLIIRFTGNNFYFGQGTSNIINKTNWTRTHGLFLATRDNSSNYILKTPITDEVFSRAFHSNSSRKAGILAEIQPNNGVVGFSNKQVAFVSMGTAINDKKDEFFTIVNNFQTALGRAV